MFGDLQQPNSLMAFGYANGNPLMYTDPLGEAVRVSAEEQKALKLFYGEDNVTFTPAGILGDTYDVSVSDAGFAHIKDYVQQTKGSEEYAQQLNRAVLDPFWRYKSLGSVANHDGEWIGQQYEDMLVPQDMAPCDWHAGAGQPGHCASVTLRDPLVVSSPESATGSYALAGGFTVPTKPYSHTGKAILNRAFPQIALTALMVLTSGLGEPEVLASRAAALESSSSPELASFALVNDMPAATRQAIVFRALNVKDATRLEAGLGLEAKNPAGSWSLGEHIALGSGKASWANDPWIATTTDLKVARAFDGGRGIVAIDLTKVPGRQARAWELYPRVNGVEGLPYHYSIWQQEVSVQCSIPREAIIGFVK